MVLWNDVLRFRCTYQQKGEVKENYNWHGYVRRDYINSLFTNEAVSSLSGVIVDNQIKKVASVGIHNADSKIDDFVDERYLFAFPGVNHPRGIMKFVIFPTIDYPIDYEFLYDEEDDCLYGVYYFTEGKETRNIHYDGFAKLTIEQEGVEIDPSEEKKFDKYELDNALTISKMLDNHMANLQQHDDINFQRFFDAKKFFKDYEEKKEAQAEKDFTRTKISNHSKDVK